MNFNVYPKNRFSSLLSESDCVEIVLQAKIADRVVYYELQSQDENSMGFLGEYLNLTIVTENNIGEKGYHSFFVKSLPTLHGEEETIEVIFKKEADIYKDIVNKIGNYSKIKWKPECYLSRDNVIVMEDLTLTGHVHVPDHFELSGDHVKSILRSLAAMHASSIVYETKNCINFGEQFKEILFETTVQKNVEWFTTGIKCLLNIAKTHPKYQSPNHQDFIANKFEVMLDPVYDMAQESKKYRNVICHRDIWRNNMLFVFEDSDYMKPVNCTLVDFQFCRYCPPAIDVLFCIYLNLRKSNRCLKECLQWYHSCLKDDLAHYEIDVDDHVPWEAFLKSCDYIKLFPILYNGLAATVIKVPKAILRDIKNTDPEMYRKFRTVNRSDVILEIMGRDEVFKEYMLEAVEELIEELMTRKSLQLGNG